MITEIYEWQQVEVAHVLVVDLMLIKVEIVPIFLDTAGEYGGKLRGNAA